MIVVVVVYVGGGNLVQIFMEMTKFFAVKRYINYLKRLDLGPSMD